MCMACKHMQACARLMRGLYFLQIHPATSILLCKSLVAQACECSQHTPMFSSDTCDKNKMDKFCLPCMQPYFCVCIQACARSMHGLYYLQTRPATSTRWSGGSGPDSRPWPRCTRPSLIHRCLCWLSRCVCLPKKQSEAVCSLWMCFCVSCPSQDVCQRASPHQDGES